MLDLEKKIKHWFGIGLDACLQEQANVKEW